MSLLRRTKNPVVPLTEHRHALLRALLEKLPRNEQTAALLNEVLETVPGLSDEERSRLKLNPADFLFPPPASPASSAPPVTDKPPAPARPEAKPVEDFRLRLKSTLGRKLLEMEWETPPEPEALRQTIGDLINAIIEEEQVLLSRAEKGQLIDAILADVVGYGVLDALMRDDAVTEIRVLGPKQIYIVRKGHFEAASVTFENEAAVLRVMDRMLAPVGKRIDEHNPIERVRLPDHSLVTMIVRPLVQQGPSLYIQKFTRYRLSAEDVRRYGTISTEALDFLYAVMLSGVNVIVTGRTASGKTALMQVLAEWLSAHPDVTSMVTIEQTTELQLSGKQVLVLQTRPPNLRGRSEVNAQQLAEFALQMYTERVILGGTNGAGMLPLLQAGRSFMVEVNATAAELVHRLQAVLQAAEPTLADLPALKLLTAEPLVVVEMQRLRDGSRKVMLIAEMLPDGSLMTMFQFEQTTEERGRIIGRMRAEPLSLSRRTLDRIEAAGIDLPPPLSPWYVPPGTHVSSPWVTIQANKREAEAKTAAGDEPGAEPNPPEPDAGA